MASEYYPPQPLPRQGNGMAVAGMVLGIVGACAGLIPLLFWVAFPCGVLAVIFGAVGRRRAAETPGAPGRGMAMAGLVLGIVALLLSVAGFAIVDDALSDL